MTVKSCEQSEHRIDQAHVHFTYVTYNQNCAVLIKPKTERLINVIMGRHEPAHSMK